MLNLSTHTPSPLATKVLLVESDPDYANLLLTALTGHPIVALAVEWVAGLSEAIQRLAHSDIDVILVDLTFPHNLGKDAIKQTVLNAGTALVIAMIAREDEKVIHQVFAQGANDYLDKSSLSANFLNSPPHTQWLPQTLKYMIDCHQSRKLLTKTEAWFRAISDASPLGIFVSDTDGSCLYSNAAYHEISGLSPQETLGTNWSKSIHPDDRQRVLKESQSASRLKAAFHSEFRFLRNDDTEVWMRINSAPVENPGSLPEQVHVVEDISERRMSEMALKAAEEALFEQKERAQVTLNSIGDAVVTTNLEGFVTYLNHVAESLTGWTSIEAEGSPLAKVFCIRNRITGDTAPDPTVQAIAENKTVGLASDSLLISRHGNELPIEDSAAPIHDRNGKASGAVIVFRDVTQSRTMTQRMAHLARHDFLTGLPNRILLDDRLSQAIVQAQRHQKQVALLFLDLDYFKKIKNENSSEEDWKRLEKWKIGRANFP